jgi:hypothetical protein
MSGEIYISTDIESDGPIPAINSMLSFASVAMTIDKEVTSSFTTNVLPYPGAVQDPETMKFWAKFPDAWNATQVNQQDCEQTMKRYLAWLTDVTVNRGLRPIFVGYPAAFDYMWVHWYLIRYTGQDPMGHAGLCMKSFGMAMQKCEFRHSVKSRYPKRWFDKLPHTHVSLDDAIEQGCMSINMIRENRGLPPIEKHTVLG